VYLRYCMAPRDQLEPVLAELVSEQYRDVGIGVNSNSLMSLVLGENTKSRRESRAVAEAAKPKATACSGQTKTKRAASKIRGAVRLQAGSTSRRPTR
jgi:hypothetical protein